MRRIDSRLNKLDSELRPSGYTPMVIVYEDTDGTATLNDVTYPDTAAALAPIPPTGPEYLIVRFVGEDIDPVH